MSDIPSALARLVRATAILALPAEDQLAWLESLGMPGKASLADEIALEFGDGASLVAQFAAKGWLSERVRSLVVELDSLLADLSGTEHSPLWEVAALESAQEWDHVRLRAKAILFAM